ncbi:alpha/beta fold hydrolase [Thalassotalea atypica]|uniref:alpha/beta fold hydrolase n=1 Tax=Thalassotalea atypica TaxID=2054316 RepID=UPI002573ADA4|nr:alpha/beta fold hydrolase [Thalassotalea atypica]
MRNMYFRRTIKQTLAMTALLVSGHALADNQPSTLYANEKAIVFKTMDNKTTNAFEGYIEVPENRNNANSRLIPVKYVRFPATEEKSGPPIIYLSGGPGGSGIDTAKYPNFRFPLFMALREFGDVIALDQRGTGASNTTPTCTSSHSVPLSKKLTADQVTKIYQASANECLAFWQQQKVDILGYTTLQSALDIDDLRKHLQAEKVTLWGISYGSHLAFAAMNTLKDKIDKVVIASAEGLNQTVKLPHETNAYFARLQQAINTQADAAKAYPDLVSLMHRVHKQLVSTPMPVSILQKDGSSVEMLFQKMHLQIIASSMIADPQRGVKHLLMLYKTLDQGSDKVLIEVLKRGYFDDKPISFKAMNFAMDIASGITDDRLAIVNEQAKTSLLGLALNFPMPQLNRSVKGLDLGDDFRKNPVNDIPTLLLTGTLDGRTYINEQNMATKGLSNLTQIKVINGGHNIFMVSPKITEVIKLFLSNKAITTKSVTVALPSFVSK